MKRIAVAVLAVLALVLLILGPLVAIKTPTDIFPNIGIPVVSVKS